MACLKKRKTSANGYVWYVQFCHEGRKVRQSLGTDKKTIARQALHKFQVMEDEGKLDLIIHKPKHVTLGEFFKVHMDHAEQTLAPRWYQDKYMYFRNRIIPFFGQHTRLQHITKARIEDFQIKRSKSVSNRTVNIETNCLMTLLRHAVDRGELEERHLPKIRKLPEIKGRLRYLEIDEIRVLRKAAQEHSPEMNAYVMLMLYAGLRSGEALNIRWEDFDQERRILHIAPRGDWVPKTRTARIVPAPNDLNEFLQARNNKMPNASLIVEGRNTPYMLKRGFRNVVKAAGLQVAGDNRVTAHTLRHTYASHLVMRGTPLYTVSALLGHSETSTTEIYAHLAPDHLQRAVQDIEY